MLMWRRTKCSTSRGGYQLIVVEEKISKKYLNDGQTRKSAQLWDGLETRVYRHDPEHYGIHVSQRTIICEVTTLINNFGAKTTSNWNKAGEDQRREAVDPDSDHTYYYNPRTRVSKWRLPTDAVVIKKDSSRRHVQGREQTDCPGKSRVAIPIHHSRRVFKNEANQIDAMERAGRIEHILSTRHVKACHT